MKNSFRYILLYCLLTVVSPIFSQADFAQWKDGLWNVNKDPNQITEIDLTKGPVTAYDFNASQYYVFNNADSTWDEILNESTRISAEIGEPLGLFGQVKTVERTPIIELKSTYGISELRDIVKATNGGTVTNDRTEYKLSTSGTSNSSATLESAERGRYLPGSEGEAGIGVRLVDSILTSGKFAQWGYYDDSDGFGFGLDTAIYLFVLRDSVYNKVYQSNWNGDKLNGADESGLDLDLLEGNIYQFNYSWYGYGAINYNIILADSAGNQRIITVHKFSPSKQTSLLNPNLPIRAEVDNALVTSDVVMYVGGRQYSVYSPFAPSKRINSERVLSKSGVGTTFVPVITFKRKSDFLSVAAKTQGFEIITDADLIYQIRVGATLTGASYGTPTNTTASETAMEADVTATAISGGELIYQGLAEGGGFFASGEFEVSNILAEIPGDLPVSLSVRTISGTATISAVVRWAEEW